MNPLLRSPMLFHGDPTLSNDVEVLQTDVMRFFAILCLCLTAIFALVKALPMSPSGDRPTIAESTDLRTEAEALQNQIAIRTEKLAEIRTQVQAASVDAEKSYSAAENAKKNEMQFLARLSTTRQELARVAQSLEEARGELKVRERKLSAIVDQIDNKQRIHADLQSKIADETQRLAKIQAKLEQVAVKLNRPLPQKKTSEKILPAESPPRQSVRKGFTLRFASDEALQQLISRGRVFFYALAGTKAWQLHLNEGKPVYSTAQFPRQIYEMQTSTVPIEYSSVFHRQVAAFGRDSVTWGVTLPSQTRDSINRLINGRDGGDLVIMSNGEVVIN